MGKKSSRDILKKVRKRFGSAVLLFFKSQAKKEVTLFSNSKYPLSFKPFFVYQGMVVLLLFVVLAFAFIPHGKINQTLVIKTAVTKQNTAVVANGNPVEWSVLVKRSDITSGNNLLKLPKSARNIKVSSITATQAKAILQAPQKQNVSFAQRQSIAIANQPKSFFAASLIDSIAKYLKADLEDATQAIVDVVAPTPDVQPTPDATIVDLSSEAPEPAPVVEPEATAEAPSNDGAAPVEVPLVEQPAPAESGTSDVPQTPVEEYVQVTYETPAPQITEQETDTGKVVTVSDSNTPKFDCETLNPNKPASPISYLFKNSLADLQEAVDQIANVVTGTPPEISNDQTPISNELPNDSISKDAEVPAQQETPAPVETPAESAKSDLTPTEAPVIDDTALGTPELAAEAAYQACLANQVKLTDVLASTKIPEIYKVGQESKIKIKWITASAGPRPGGANNDVFVSFHAYDTDGNGKLDYVEWTVPHLSTQTFEIIFISKAFYLDSNREIQEDIYDTVKEQDGNFATVPQDNYVRVTFNDILDNTKDITIHMKPNAQSIGTPTIEVYPVYTDENGNQTEGPKIATFPAITSENTYRIELTNLQTPTDTFDLKTVKVE